MFPDSLSFYSYAITSLEEDSVWSLLARPKLVETL